MDPEIDEFNCGQKSFAREICFRGFIRRFSFSFTGVLTCCTMNNTTALILFAMISIIYCRHGSRSGPSSTSPCHEWQASMDRNGAIVFLFDDESFQIPSSSLEMQTATCPRLSLAEQRLKATIKSCLKPFPQTIAGFLTHGARQVRKLMCDSAEAQADFVHHMQCMRQEDRISKLRAIMNDYASKLMIVHESIPMEEKFKLAYCSSIQVKSQIAAASRPYCSPDAVRYLVNAMDGVYKEARKLAHSLLGYKARSYKKCHKLITDSRLLLRTRAFRRKTKSSFLPLFLVLNDLN